MKIAIFSRNIISENLKKILSLISFFENNDVELVFYSLFFEKIKQHLPNSEKYETFNDHTEVEDVPYILSLGGDGTMLDCIASAYNKNAYLIGVNFGRLGFLNSVDIDEFSSLFKQVVNNDFEYIVRELLKVECKNGSIDGPNYALNEFCISKTSPNAMISVEAYINNELLNTYWADGLIVATPTGSTGYSLSCNGPVVFPNTKCFVITPIAAHNLNVRPVVAPYDSEITLKVKSRNKEVACTLDARKYIIESNAVFVIKKQTFDVKIMRHKESTFTETIRKKLYWGNDVRNKQ